MRTFDAELKSILSPDRKKQEMTYKQAGVDIDKKMGIFAGMRHLVESTYTKDVIVSPEGFAGFFSLRRKLGFGLSRMREPVIVSCTDGVGTKLKIAFMMNKHDTVGIDLVAMSVNDLIVCGAEPLFFLDYLAFGKLSRSTFFGILEGIVRGCRMAGCALLGGETAEMPGFYEEGEYEMAGFAVGVVERKDILDGKSVRRGDVVIGLASSGLHSNGYSLARKVLLEMAKLPLKRKFKEFGHSLGEELLIPTRIYARPVLSVLKKFRSKGAIKAMANITGGGFYDNIPRVLPEGVDVVIDSKAWEVPPIFGLIQRLGNVPMREMYRTFNMGIGFVVIAASRHADSVAAAFRRHGEKAHIIGHVVEGKRRVII